MTLTDPLTLDLGGGTTARFHGGFEYSLVEFPIIEKRAPGSVTLMSQPFNWEDADGFYLATIYHRVTETPERVQQAVDAVVALLTMRYLKGE